tara:strand:+ start:2622 stop:2840 length:219 start_codon:yes stop_codon:yes gene_type:complete
MNTPNWTYKKIRAGLYRVAFRDGSTGLVQKLPNGYDYAGWNCKLDSDGGDEWSFGITRDEAVGSVAHSARRV